MKLTASNLKPLSQRDALRAFTLLELLLVIILITLLAAMGIPAIKGLTQSNAMTAATRQLLDDVAAARQKAINNRTKVYMVFVPPNFWFTSAHDGGTPNWTSDASLSNALHLAVGQYTTYALFAEHSIGDQPGQTSPRYLTKWKTLPEGVIIETNMFRLFLPPGSTISEPELISEPPFMTNPPSPRMFPIATFMTNVSFPFPHTETTNATPAKYFLPYIAFDSSGRLVSGPPQRDFFIPLAKASIFPSRNADQQPTLDPADVIEPGYREADITNYNLIHIDWLTGRAKVERLGPP